MERLPTRLTGCDGQPYDQEEAARSSTPDDHEDASEADAVEATVTEAAAAARARARAARVRRTEVLLQQGVTSGTRIVTDGGLRVEPRHRHVAHSLTG